jgi:phosphopantetheine adenylyltransferase
MWILAQRSSVTGSFDPLANGEVEVYDSGHEWFAIRTVRITNGTLSEHL